MEQSFLPVEGLAEHPYRTILGYPRATDGEISTRIREMKDIGVETIAFTGGVTINGLGVLGKGYVGLVVLAHTSSGHAALKIRRTDSPRADMSDEAHYMRVANGVGVGPRLWRHSKNLVLMEYLEGVPIREWVYGLDDRKGSVGLKRVVRSILQDCFRLDCIGLDHGELVNISKHVIVGEDRATIIDFESSSMDRRAANVTSAAQSLYIGSGLAKRMSNIYDTPGRSEMIEALRAYKRDRTKKSFDGLLDVLGVRWDR